MLNSPKLVSLSSSAFIFGSIHFLQAREKICTKCCWFFLENLKTRNFFSEIYWPLVITDIFYLSLIGVTSEDQKGTNNADIPTKSLEDALACLELECNQTFLGMVQMQYQALVDIVQLIDLLEKACIRFVHFRSGSCHFDRASMRKFEYRKVSSSRPVYYSISEPFGQRSQYISIKFPLHKQSENP